MHITVPPGQKLPEVTGAIIISRSEATELRDALDLVIAEGSSEWNVKVHYVDVEASVTLAMELDNGILQSR